MLGLKFYIKVLTLIRSLNCLDTCLKLKYVTWGTEGGGGLCVGNADTLSFDVLSSILYIIVWYISASLWYSYFYTLKVPIPLTSQVQKGRCQISNIQTCSNVHILFDITGENCIFDVQTIVFIYLIIKCLRYLHVLLNTLFAGRFQSFIKQTIFKCKFYIIYQHKWVLNYTCGNFMVNHWLVCLKSIYTLTLTFNFKDKTKHFVVFPRFYS